MKIKKYVFIFVAVLLEISCVTEYESDNCFFDIKDLGESSKPQWIKPLMITHTNCYSAFSISGLWFLNVSHPIFCFSQNKKTTAFFIVADEYNDLHDFDNFQVGGHEVYHHSFTHDPLGNLTIQRESASNEQAMKQSGQSSPLCDP